MDMNHVVENSFKKSIGTENGHISGISLLIDIIRDHPSAILIINGSDNTIAGFSKAAAELYHYDPSDLYNLNIGRLFGDSNSNMDSYSKHNNTQIAQHKTKSGELINVKVEYSKFDSDNLSYYFMSINPTTDIDEDIRALKEKSEWFETIFQSSLSGIIIIEKETHKIVDINEAALNMIGAERDYVMGRVCHNFVCPASVNCCPVTDLNQKILYEEKILYKKDGGKLDIIKSVNEKSFGGKSYLIESIIDISDRIKAEKELLESEAKFRDVFESIDDLYYRTDMEGSITLLSPSVYELTGWHESELIGRNASEVYLNPDDRKSMLSSLSIHGYIKDYELLLTKKDGTPIPVSLTGGIILDESGNPVGVRGMLRDITKRKHAEEIQRYFQKFRTTLLNLSERFISFSLDQVDFLFDSVLKEIGEFLNIDRSYIFTTDWVMRTVTNTHEWCATGISAEKDNLQDIPMSAMTEWMNELEAFRNIHIPSVSALPESWAAVRDILEAQNIQSLVVVPLAKNNNLLGFIGFDSVVKERYWHEEEISLLGILAYNISNAIDRAKAEESLRASEERYRYLAENMADVVWVVDVNKMQYQYISPSVERLRGFTPEEVLNQSIEESMTAESFAAVQEKIKERVPSYLEGDIRKATSIDEIVQPCKNGTFIVSEIVTTIYGDKLENLKIIGVTRDITQRKRTESALIENEKRLSIFFSMSLVGFYFMMLDQPVEWFNKSDKELLIEYIFENMRMTEFNDALLEQYSSSREDFLGTNLNKIFYHNLEYGKEVVKKLLDDGDLSMVTEERKSDGIQLWIEGSYKCIYDEEGRLIGHFGVQKDITNRVYSEAKIAKLTRGIEQSPVSIVITDKYGIIEYVNPKFTELTGYSSYDALGKNSNLLKSDYHDKEYYQYLWDTINSGDEWIGEFCNKKKNGEIFWENASISSIKDNNGEITHFIAVKEDITERKKTEAELQELIHQLRESNKIIEDSLYEKNSLIIELSETQEKLEKTNSEKDKFFSIIAHDLRNPFAALISNSDLLETYYHKMDDDKRIKLIKGMKDASKFTYSLLENLLQWSRAQMGTFLVKPDRVTLYPLLIRLTMVLKAQAENKQIELLIDCDDRLVPFCDPDMIETVIRNLVSNAIKFSNPNSKIKIEAGNYELNSGFYVINVKDSGVGIPPDKISSLFKIAGNVSTTGTNNENGSGLGLLLCKEFVEMNGGKIWAASKEGIGSTFSFTIPKPD